MPRRSKTAGVLLLIAAFVAIVCAWLLYQSATPATMTVPSVSSSPSPKEPLPSVTTPPTPIPTNTPAKKLENPRGDPVSLTIKRGAKTIVETMPFMKRRVNGRIFESQCGAVAYWDKPAKPAWPKPGVESLNKSLITGHVMCGPTNWYPLKHLQPKKLNGKEIPGGRKDDLLYIQYSSGDLVIAQAKEDSHDIVKTGPKGPNSDPKYKTNGGKKAREIRLTTCDRTNEIRADGHAKYNVVQRFKVIDVIRATDKKGAVSTSHGCRRMIAV